MVVGATPVRDHDPVVSPFVSEDIFQKMCVLIRVGAVHLVVACHQRFRTAFFYGDLKTGQINLSQRSLVNHRIHRHAPQFLAVHRKMLRTGISPLALNAPDISGSHLSRQIRIFGKILKVSSAQRASLDIKPRPQDHMDSLHCCFLSQGSPDLFSKIRGPAVRHGRRSGETSRRQRGVQAQMVTRPSLLANTMGTVRTVHGRDPQAVKIPGLPLSFSGKEGSLFFQRHLFDQFSMFHIRYLILFLSGRCSACLINQAPSIVLLEACCHLTQRPSAIPAEKTPFLSVSFISSRF